MDLDLDVNRSLVFKRKKLLDVGGDLVAQTKAEKVDG
jgi:hypothetical protein